MKRTLVLTAAILVSNLCLAQDSSQSTDPRETAWEGIKKRQTELRREADERGRSIVSKSSVKYKLVTSKDQMTGRETLTARNDQRFGLGIASTEIFCRGKSLFTKTTLTNIDVPLDYYWGKLGTSGRLRVNGKVDSTSFPIDGRFKNVFLTEIGTVLEGHVGKHQTLGYSRKWQWEVYKNQGADYWEDCWTGPTIQFACPDWKPRFAFDFVIYDFAIEFETTSGGLFIETNPYDPSIRRVSETCR